MGRMLRERIIGELTEKYKDADHCVFVDFSGLSVEAIGQLRRQISERGMDFFIAKNSLLKLALEKVGLPAKEDVFKSPTAVLSGGEDPVAVCKLIVDWQKKTKTTEIKGGILERKTLTSSEVIELSTVPPREMLLSQILGVFIAPLTDVATLLDNTVSQFANLLSNHVEKLEKTA